MVTKGKQRQRQIEAGEKFGENHSKVVESIDKEVTQKIGEPIKPKHLGFLYLLAENSADNSADKTPPNTLEHSKFIFIVFIVKVL